MTRVLWLLAIVVTVLVLMIVWQFSSVESVKKSAHSTETAPASTVAVLQPDSPDFRVEQPAVIPPTACILRTGVSSTDRVAFLQRHSDLGLSEPELNRLIQAIQQDGFNDSLLANYQAEVSELGDSSFALVGELQPAASDSGGQSARREANRRLLSAYRAVQSDIYDYSEPEFDQAVMQFVDTYRNHPSDGAMLLYLHMRAAEQQYWRFSRQADWRRWVHFEHHRQALIWFIERYGKPEHLARIRQDRHLVSTVNRYSGELDRGFGPVMGAPVDEKVAFYIAHFELPEEVPGNAPTNYAEDEGAVSYQKNEPGALDRLLAELWPKGADRTVTDLFVALARDCQG